MEYASLDPMVTCPHCEMRTSKEMHDCPNCGAAIKRPALNRIARCPTCQIHLTDHDFRGADIHVCQQCSGVWCDSPDFARLTSERDVFADASIPYEYVRQPLSGPEPYLPCPRCDEMMNRSNFRKVSGILIDSCADHGVWLQPGELEQLRCFIATGGLEKSLEVEIRENRSDLESLATQFHNAEFNRKILQNKSFKSWFFS